MLTLEPGMVLELRAADYCYGTQRLRLRLIQPPETRGLPLERLEWVELRGERLDDRAVTVERRVILARVDALAAAVRVERAVAS
ncbi:hypothetical protein J2S43_007842 [Catenuloplanes nepalensis]|uniref:Uncharacterized protein n=1 Tax=Catenuloplanes nepalensis TaxID=587533 RepID=A0ABT9N6K3_9ACTN|nr:hypothetical protein [Catenuloplanes nepalensis]MDP9799330.1 hypothetical protein [Catenuloplanes nepalensis]